MYTGDTSFNVITIYPDEATATAAIAKQNAIRSQAAADLPVRLVGELRGDVFASLQQESKKRPVRPVVLGPTRELKGDARLAKPLS